MRLLAISLTLVVPAFGAATARATASPWDAPPMAADTILRPDLTRLPASVLAVASGTGES